MSTTLMKCGHTAQAEGKNGPCCVICIGINPGATIVDDRPPELEGRMAVCTSCRRTAPSSLSMAFFEFRGEGSTAATDRCKICGLSNHAHSLPTFNRSHSFEPHGAWDQDIYYDGCRGWS